MADKEAAVRELEEISKQLQSVIEQLRTDGKAYYSSPEIASFIPAIPGLNWGCGVNPKTKIKQFTAYFTDY